jgi:nitroreductase
MSTTISSSHTSNPAFSGASLVSALNWRYATKVFDSSKKLSASQWAALEQALVLSPSSFGLQPWKFVNVTDPEVRAKLKPVSWNQSQTTDASHFVVFASRIKVEKSDIQKYLECIAETRGVPLASLDSYKQMMEGSLLTRTPQAAHEWASRQCYIALGNLMTSAAVVGIDACPMEGIDPSAYDTILGLPTMGFSTVVACAVGFRSTSDKYAQQKKVRFSVSQVVVEK